MNKQASDKGGNLFFRCLFSERERQQEKAGKSEKREKKGTACYCTRFRNTQDLARPPGEELLRGDQCQGAAFTVGR